MSHNLSNLNIYTNLNQSKQNRWLLKNSLLSNSISSNLFHFTQAKSLVGNSLYNSSSTSTNIWNSAKLSQSSKINELSNLSFFKMNSLTNASTLNTTNLALLPNSTTTLANFNFFEESQFWNTKKYFFTNQLKSNLIQLSNSQFLNLTPTNSYSLNKSKLTLLLNQQNKVFVNQVTPFYVSDLVKESSSSNPNLSISLGVSQVAYTGAEFDHLTYFNSNFLTSLTLSNTLNNLPVYEFSAKNDNNLKKLTTLTFKS
jgi:hypothetical protein